jgi:hypothetical protein
MDAVGRLFSNCRELLGRTVKIGGRIGHGWLLPPQKFVKIAISAEMRIMRIELRTSFLECRFRGPERC